MFSAVPHVSDRVLRPMILTKQLELPSQGYGDFPYVSPQTPRTNLVKELEKYNHPSHDFTIKSWAKEPPVFVKQRPLAKPQYRYEPLSIAAPMNLSFGCSPGYSLPPPSPTSSVSSTMSDQSETLDLSMKRSSHLDLSMKRSSHDGVFDDHVLSDGSQDEPVDFSRKPVDVYENGIVVGGEEGDVAAPVSSYETTMACLGESPGDSPGYESAS